MELSEELTIKDFFHVINRRKKEFLGCWASVVLGAFVYTALVTPTFRAEVLLRIQIPENEQPSIEIGGLNLQQPGTSFNIEQLLSPAVLEESIKSLYPGRQFSKHELAVEVDKLHSRSSIVYRDRDRQLVSLSVVSPDGKAASIEANALSHKMVNEVGAEMTMKAHKTKTFIESQLKEVERKLRESEDRMRYFQEKHGPQSVGNYLVNQLMELRNRRTQLTSKYTQSHPAVQQVNSEIRTIERQLQQLPNQEIDMARIAREVRLNEELFTMLTKRLEEARILESARIAPVTIIDPAIEPVVPESPKKRFNYLAGLVIGFVLGLIVVLAHQHFDTSMVTPEEIEKFLQLPVLAAIPHIERRKTPPEMAEGPVSRRADRLGTLRSRLLVNFSPQSANSEVHHILRNNLMKGLKHDQHQVYLFTSAVVGEGKSITAANFALAAAQAGVPTLLADADLRKPMVHKLFGLHHEPGLTNFFYTSPRWESYLVGWDQVEATTPKFKEAQNVTGLSNLRLLPSGRIPGNPVPLLSSDRFAQLLAEMKARFRLVIIDAAPAMLFADASIMGPLTDGVVLVYRFGRTAREALRRTHTQLSASDAKILGVVVNDIMQGEAADYNGYYSMYEDYESDHQKARLA